MHSENTILIRGDARRIFDVAADIQEWPRFLRHYRYVILEDRSSDYKIARMGASRSGIPVWWRARQDLLPAERRIHFSHIGGISKGMEVEWEMVPEGDDVRVTIRHDLAYAFPVLGSMLAGIIGSFFVKNIAGLTLRRIKQKVEAEARTLAAS